MLCRYVRAQYTLSFDIPVQGRTELAVQFHLLILLPLIATSSENGDKFVASVSGQALR